MAIRRTALARKVVQNCLSWTDESLKHLGGTLNFLAQHFQL